MDSIGIKSGKLGAGHRSLQLGRFQIAPNVVLSPMSGVTDIAFRRLCKELAGGRVGLMVSEFVSVDGCHSLDPRFVRQMRFHQNESPFCIQIFGARPERMASGAQEVEAHGADFVEINCGCPVPKVVGRGGGAGLLRDLPRLAQIVRSVRSAVRIPVLVKVRIGWDSQSVNVLETLKIAEGEGAELLTVHGRTRSQGYAGLADWETIARVKQVANIPISGNGDIRTAKEAMLRLDTTGVDAVGIGRASMHNPWVLGEIADAWEGKPLRRPSAEEQLRAFERYQELLVEDGYEPMRTLGRLKQMSARLVKCHRPAVPELRSRLLRCQTVSEFFDMFSDYATSDSGRASRFEPEAVEELNGTDAETIRCTEHFTRTPELADVRRRLEPLTNWAT